MVGMVESASHSRVGREETERRDAAEGSMTKELRLWSGIWPTRAVESRLDHALRFPANELSR